MPRHVYHARNEPPSLLDRVLHHPFEVTFALIFLLGGVVMLAEVMVDGFTPSPAMEQPPRIVALMLAAVLLSAVVGIIVGLFHDFEDLRYDWLAERVGLAAGGIGLLTYALAVGWQFPHSTLSWGIPLIMSLGPGLRVWATFAEERRRRETVADMKGLV